MSTTLAYRVEGEKELLDLVDLQEGWKLIEKFSTLVRESGTPDEVAAAEYIAARLKANGVPFEMHEPTIYISVPRKAELQVQSNGSALRVKAKTPAFSLSTNGKSVQGDVVYVPAARAKDTAEVFGSHFRTPNQEVRGKIVVTEGRSVPIAVRQLQERGAIAQIYINPGKNIHEGICTPIWGSPTLSSWHRKPASPVVTINQADGTRLIDLCKSGRVAASLATELDEGWKRCLLPVARIEGAREPELFVLVHGHYDSWHVGIGDNATGDGTMLELARIFQRGRRNLHRSVRIAWWPGHSHGRYAGSTWYADRFGMDLRKNCIAQVDIDSPGCRMATAFEEVMWMAECEELCSQAILDRSETNSVRSRPLRAGDYSFNQIGLSGFFMLLSNIPLEQRRTLGFYPVGGCGGNIAWHTEEDLLEVADPDVFRRDLEIYITALVRLLNSEILPFDYSLTVDEIRQAVQKYEAQAGEKFSLVEVLRSLDELDHELGRLTSMLGKLGNRHARQANRILLEIGRRLVPLNYSYGENFDHDPAEPLPPLPKLRDVEKLSRTEPESATWWLLQTELVRQRNKVINVLYETTELVRAGCALLESV